jgi:hypothetical protein
VNRGISTRGLGVDTDMLARKKVTSREKAETAVGRRVT